MDLAVGRGAAWLAAGYLGRSIAYAVLTAVLARSLGVAGFGELSLFLALTAGIAFLAGSWPFLAVPVLAGEGHSIRAVLRPAAILAGAGAVIASLIVVPLSGQVASTDASVVIYLLTYSAALVGLQGAYSVLQTRGRMAGIAATQTAERLLAVAAIAVLAALGPLTVRSAQFALVVAATAACVGIAIWITQRIPLSEGAAAPVETRDVLDAVGPMAIVAASSYAVAWVDLFLLGVLVSDRELGLYALAYQIYTFVLQLGALWVVAVLPHHARRARRQAVESLVDPSTLNVAARLWTAGVVALGLAAMLGFNTVFGDGFGGSRGPLLLLLASAALLAPYFAAVPALLATRHAAYLAGVSAAGALLNVGLDLILIPVIGAWGPAIATAAQTLLAASLLATRALGRRAGWAAILTCLPGAGVLALAAIDPDEPALLWGLGLAAAALAVTGVRALRAADLDAPAPAR